MNNGAGHCASLRASKPKPPRNPKQLNAGDPMLALASVGKPLSFRFAYHMVELLDTSIRNVPLNPS
jgi:hypothetical protein